MANPKCLITANREEAKFFSFENGSLAFIKKFENEDGGARNREFQTDRPGSKTGGIGKASTHGVGGNKDPKSDVELGFAKFLAKTIPSELSTLEYSEVSIAAEPHLQGMLKSEFKRHAPQLEITWLAEDWNNLPTNKIEKLLAQKSE